MAYVFYSDTLWVTFFLINSLYSLGQIMVKYNYSSVSDTNPISIAIHGGIYPASRSFSNLFIPNYSKGNLHDNRCCYGIYCVQKDISGDEGRAY